MNKSNWSGVLAMTLCVFALVASEFMPVSLLSSLSSDLSVTEGMAGQGISISGVFAVITSLTLSSLARNVDRRHLLLGMTLLMALSSTIIGLAPNYLVYMIGRIFIGIAIGGFWSMSAATAIRLVSPRHIPKALAIFNSGNALATVIAAPLGSYLGAIIGWRGAFLLLIPVSLIAFLWQWLVLPSMQAKSDPGQTSSALGLLKHRVVLIGMAACGLFFMGQFALFTYLRPYLETVTHISAPRISLTLLVIGVSGFAGTLLIGKALKAGFYQTLIIIPLLMAIIAAVLIGVGANTAIVVSALGVWGLIATAAPVGWWSWVANTFENEAEAGGGLMVAVVQLSIALGSTVGGVAFDSSGYRGAFSLSAGILLLAALMGMMTWHSTKNVNKASTR
ncbi:MAG: MFS transporter [Erwinia sp.]